MTTLLLLVTYAALVARQISSLRIESNALERTWLDGVQLLHIQTDLNQLAALMRDLVSDHKRSIAHPPHSSIA